MWKILPNAQIWTQTAEEIGCQLAISFHATTDEVRDKLVPINKKWRQEKVMFQEITEGLHRVHENLMRTHRNLSKQNIV